PDIVEAILGGSADQRVMLETLERPLPAAWDEQRTGLAGPPTVTQTARARGHLAADAPPAGAHGGTGRGA
ncbi:MAG TPA: hypothetical protein VFY87_13790, partial [Geminicoccaceae bacterium]|nr:hypothetical protein [Geminicoccaceae bacterium]